MRIALFERTDGRRRLGVVKADHIIDVTEWAGPRLAAFIERSASAPPPQSGDQVALSDVVWLPPALGSPAPLCVGLNYGTRSVSGNPALFTRYWSSLVGHNHPILRPSASASLDFEGELVIIIGKPCRAVPRDRALDVIAGYTIGQDGSVRDFQRAAPTPTAAKNFARSGAIGPWMTTADELPDPAALRITTTLNGEVMQDAPTADLRFDVPALIEHITTFMPLAPGDVIFTGTPPGSLADRGSTTWLKPGDTVSVTISAIGTLTNHILDEQT